MSASPASAPQNDAAAGRSEDRAAYVAVLVFPLLVLAGGAAGYLFAPAVHQAAPWTNPLLGLVMFGMGLTLRPADFALVATRPVPILVGVMAQYVLMPGIAVLVSWALQLPPEIAAGVILVGCAPGGTASNVVSYLARGDVAVSVTMTSISTLLAPLLTPLLTLWLAGAYMPLNGGSMARSIAMVVLLPVLAGLVVRLVLPRVVARLLPVLPWLSVLTIAVIVAIVVSGSAEKILQAGLLVLVAVAVHNALGMTLGWLVGRVTGQPAPVRRTTAIEVGMQNSGLAAGLAAQYMSPLAALPGAVFSVWHNLSGAVFALLCRRADARTARTAD
ncbi:bile acid:sodium symporter family protein [Kocuria rhizophila]|uniref:bile acid:sodium symporter family protein n=1 Tax=Kocuria rhizophila TaxID=72000 RepID=UPI00294A696A|nr:bile acid:sodium symporter family protein [Kocuria rhizophila]MDV5999108.1 bile acid:sodium symporter family protein [Kocuria rhizophila]